jgi:hypothetical protein
MPAAHQSRLEVQEIPLAAAARAHQLKRRTKTHKIPDNFLCHGKN